MKLRFEDWFTVSETAKQPVRLPSQLPTFTSACEIQHQQLWSVVAVNTVCVWRPTESGQHLRAGGQEDNGCSLALGGSRGHLSRARGPWGAPGREVKVRVRKEPRFGAGHTEAVVPALPLISPSDLGCSLIFLGLDFPICKNHVAAWVAVPQLSLMAPLSLFFIFPFVRLPPSPFSLLFISQHLCFLSEHPNYFTFLSFSSFYLP